MSEFGRLLADLTRLRAEEEERRKREAVVASAPRRFSVTRTVTHEGFTLATLVAYGVMWEDQTVTMRGVGLHSMSHYKRIEDIFAIHGDDLSIGWFD